ncbi:MAG: efflux RND transporter periplasmic adaptor subunit [Phascolarctobacterium sp.]|nr:efflux RND transporter periplasmic adaptor subunit [Phascolarctobacterium sp.]
MNLQNRKVKILLAVLIAICVIVAYRIYSNVQNDKARAARMSQKRDIPVTLCEVSRKTMIPTMKFSGTLDADLQADVAPKVDARIEKVYVQLGDHVKKGQILASLEKIDHSAALIVAKGSYNNAKSDLVKAELDFKRYQTLYEQNAVSRAVYDTYYFNLQACQSKVESARGTYEGMVSKLEATDLVAPVDGIIAKRYYQEGYYAKAGTAIFSVADTSKLKTVIDIPEGNVASVAVGNTCEIVLPAFNNKKIEGTISRIAPVATIPGHTFEAEVSVDNKENLRAGVYANVTLKGEPKENVLVIPQHAIVMRDDQKTAFVPDENGVVTRKVLAIGYTDETHIEILAGLKDGDKVVLEGQNKLREGSKIKMDEAGK